MIDEAGQIAQAAGEAAEMAVQPGGWVAVLLERSSRG